MSLNFANPVNVDALKLIQEAFGEPVASDDKTFLFDRRTVIRQTTMGAIARVAGQIATVEVNGIGDIKTMIDGTRYECIANGWRRL